MKIIFPILIVLILLYSCDQKKSEKNIPAIEKVEIKSVKLQKIAQTVIREYTSNTDKIFIVKEEKKSSSLNEITIIPKGFTEVNESIQIEESDPLLEAIIADINNDGFDELYLITQSAGSGSYGTIYGFVSNNDKSITPISIPKISEKDLKGNFKGYMGHDSIYVSNNKLYRKYPVYKKGDANCCPTGGDNTLQHVLKQGEASWVLEIRN